MRSAPRRGFKSRKDDVADTVSQLSALRPFTPGEEIKTEYIENEYGTHILFEDEEDEFDQVNSTVF